MSKRNKKQKEKLIKFYVHVFLLLMTTIIFLIIFNTTKTDYIPFNDMGTETSPEIATVNVEIPQQHYNNAIFEITAYCIENYPHICNNGNSQTTASGNAPIPYKTVAVDTSLIPFGTKLYIEGIGEVIANDTGGAIKGYKLDLLVKTHQEALKFGRKKINVMY